MQKNQTSTQENNPSATNSRIGRTGPATNRKMKDIIWYKTELQKNGFQVISTDKMVTATFTKKAPEAKKAQNLRITLELHGEAHRAKLSILVSGFGPDLSSSEPTEVEKYFKEFLQRYKKNKDSEDN